jgi:hypothetical protein
MLAPVDCIHPGTWPFDLHAVRIGLGSHSHEHVTRPHCIFFLVVVEGEESSGGDARTVAHALL